MNVDEAKKNARELLDAVRYRREQMDEAGIPGAAAVFVEEGRDVETIVALLDHMDKIEVAVAWGLSKTVVGLESPAPNGDQAVVAFGRMEDDGRVTVTHCGTGSTFTDALLDAHPGYKEAS